MCLLHWVSHTHTHTNTDYSNHPNNIWFYVYIAPIVNHYFEMCPLQTHKSTSLHHWQWIIYTFTFMTFSRMETYSHWLCSSVFIAREVTVWLAHNWCYKTWVAITAKPRRFGTTQPRRSANGSQISLSRVCFSFVQRLSFRETKACFLLLVEIMFAGHSGLTWLFRH